MILYVLPGDDIVDMMLRSLWILEIQANTTNTLFYTVALNMSPNYGFFVCIDAVCNSFDLLKKICENILVFFFFC